MTHELLFIGGVGMQEILLIALVILLFFGGKKIGAAADVRVKLSKRFDSHETRLP